MSLLLYALAAVYILGVTSVASIGFYDESRVRNPDYGAVVKIALLWPWYIFVVRTYNWFQNR